MMSQTVWLSSGSMVSTVPHTIIDKRHNAYRIDEAEWLSSSSMTTMLTAMRLTYENTPIWYVWNYLTLSKNKLNMELVLLSFHANNV